MSTNFECLVKYNNYNYSIVVNNNINSISFAIIYEKIKEMIENAINEVIGFETHLFELFDPKFNEYVIIDCNKEIKNLSRIRVWPKSQNKVNNKMINETDFKPKSKTISKLDSLKTGLSQYSFSKQSKSSVNCVSDPRLLKLKLDLKPESYNRFKTLLKVIKIVSNNDCNQISENEWNFLIPNKMFSIGYRNVEKNYWRTSFNNFLDLYIQVLERTTNYETSCSIFPFFNEFNSMALDRNLPNYERVMQLRENMNKMRLSLNDSDSSCAKKAEEMERNKDLTNRKTESSEEDNKINFNPFESIFDMSLEKIEGFHLMVQVIKKILANSQKVSEFQTDHWREVTDRMRENGFNGLTVKQCSNSFYKFVSFYVKNFDALRNASDDHKICTIFRLLKIVHTIDLSLFYKWKSYTYRRLMAFAKSAPIQNYLYHEDKYKQMELKSRKEERSADKMLTKRNIDFYNRIKFEKISADRIMNNEGVDRKNSCYQRRSSTFVPKDPNVRLIESEAKSRKQSFSEDVSDNFRKKVKIEFIDLY